MIIDYQNWETLGRVYDFINYPAGELQIRIKPEYVDEITDADKLIIKARLTDGESGVNRSLVGLLHLVSAIRDLTADPVNLHIPYLPYSRADRRFVRGDCRGLEVFGDILNTARFDEVRTLDIHNWSMANLYVNHLTNIMPYRFIHSAITDLMEHRNAKGLTVLFPDEGACNRYSLKNESINTLVQVLHASKKRNSETGVLEGFTVPKASEFAYEDIMIVDDICDGGGTFRGIANKLDEQQNSLLALCVTHGIFSKGFLPLLRFYRIYTTDSVLPFTGSESEKLAVTDAFKEME